MIKWKQRLYALFLRRALEPFLDSTSRQILHESIDVSFKEGTFALSNIGLCTSYLNEHIEVVGVRIKKARVESITIQLSLVEGRSSSTAHCADPSAASSLAWRAINVGSTVALVAHVEINGTQLEVQPISKERSKTNDESTGCTSEVQDDNSSDALEQTKGMLSGYFEAALGSLRLTLNVTNLSVKVCRQTARGTRSFIELKLLSLTYQNLDLDTTDEEEIATEWQQRTARKAIFEKTVLFQGVTLSAGESTIESNVEEHLNSVSTIAMAQGTGQVSVRAVEVMGNNSCNLLGQGENKRVQQDIDVRVNQQVKVSVGETSLLQILIVANGFGSDQSADNDTNLLASEMIENELGSVLSERFHAESGMNEMELYTFDGIMKQYQEARQLAERNEVRGGILVPSNAFEEGDNVGEGDSRSFDVFFDANDKSFHNYTSLMKSSVIASQGGSSSSEFVHTKLRLNLAGGGLKMSFRGGKSDKKTYLGPEEYVLLTFSDLEITSRVSHKKTELCFQVSQMEIDGAQISHSSVMKKGRPRVEIGNLLCFREPPDEVGGKENILLQPACVSMHVAVNTDVEDNKRLELELSLKPVELIYRERTLSRLHELVSKLGGGEASETCRARNEGKEDIKLFLNSALCTVSSLTVTLPVNQDSDAASLFIRCGHCSTTSSTPESALGCVLDNFSFAYKQCGDQAEDAAGMESAMTTLDVHSFLVFASSSENTNSPVERKIQVIDVCGATGRFEVDPFIPITLAYKRNVKEKPEEGNVAKVFFPSVPAFSSFKARQEDEEADNEIDRVLSEKLSNVNVDSRRSLRAKNPQDKMLLESGRCEAVLILHAPDIVLDLAKEEMEVLLVMVNSVIPKTERTKMEEKKTTFLESAIAVSVAIDAISLCILEKQNHGGPASWSSHLLRLGKCHAYAIVGGDSSWRFCRLLAHDATFYEINGLHLQGSAGPHRAPQTVQARALNLKNRTTRKRGASAAPIFYRSKLFPAISHGSPSILLDVTQDQSERSVFISLYHMTYRCDPDSKWIEMLQTFFMGVMQRQKYEAQDPEYDENQASLTRVFFSLADCNFDYTSLRLFTTQSRSILRVGDLRFSSNIVKHSPSQAFSLSMGDFSWSLCNTRASHNFENHLLPEGGHILAAKDLAFDPNQFRGGLSATTTETVFRDMCFKTVLTLESVDAIIVKGADWESGELKVLPLKGPGLVCSLTAGQLSWYACKDSFKCFTETIRELQTKVAAKSETEMEEMKAQMSAEQLEKSVSDKMIMGQEETIADVAPIPVDRHNDFSLDGYDWTTIDHTSSNSEIPPGEEQSARWFNASPIHDGHESGNFKSSPGPLEDTSTSVSSQPRIINQHFPLHTVTDPLSDGDMDASKFAGSQAVSVDTRVLLHDLKVKVRFFDGYDWPECQGKQKRDPKSLFVIAEQSSDKSKNRDGDQLKSGAHRDKKSALLGGLLVRGEQTGSTFGDLPLSEERVRHTLAQNGLRRLSRRTSSYIQLSACGVSTRIDSFCESTGHQLKTCVSLSLRDFFLAETISSLNPTKMFGEWFNEVEHPRDSRDGLFSLKMATWDPQCPLTPEKALASEECELSLTLAPMRCILDQRAIQFAQAFFDVGDESKDPASKSQDWTADLNLVPAPHVRSLRVMPWKIKVDYTPRMVDTEALKHGSVIELLNLSPLDAMVLTLPQVEIENTANLGKAIQALMDMWLGDVKSTQLHKFLANARPFEPLTTVSAGVADLFVLPWDAYRSGGNVSRAFKSSVSSLIGNVAHQTLTTSSRVTGYIANEMAKATVSSESRAGSSNTSIPSRPMATPRSVGDTASHAVESLARGVQTANYKVIIVPYREYCRSGTTGAFCSIARGIPIAIAAPVGGASEALSYALLGARNQIRPDVRKEEEVSQSGLHHSF